MSDFPSTINAATPSSISRFYRYDVLLILTQSKLKELRLSIAAWEYLFIRLKPMTRTLHKSKIAFFWSEQMWHRDLSSHYVEIEDQLENWTREASSELLFAMLLERMPDENEKYAAILQSGEVRLVDSPVYREIGEVVEYATHVREYGLRNVQILDGNGETLCIFESNMRG
ncbi:hypothetical protein ACQ4M3_39695 [Leptolyngbya sp. AN03gr2]|uniref:hypothetical protein n=1 Tax=unclassified Leptolyngbya TaxID=2650499 RepID=UPI003D310CA4